MNKTVTVFERYSEEVKKELVKLEKKAIKYGSFFTYTLGEPYVKDIPVTRIDPVTQVIYEVDKVPCLVRDVTISSDDIKANGWTVSAQLEHFESGNIVTNFGENKINPRWQKAKPYCDHCNSHRNRKITYICVNPDGEEKQVGSTCLHDYTGINPALAVFWAQAWFKGYEVEDSYDSYDCVGTCRIYDVSTIIGRAIDCIATCGYIKSDMPHSTKQQVLDDTEDHIFPSEETMEKAKAIVAWLKAEKDNFQWDSIENKCAILATQGWCKLSHVGLLAYIPVAYDRFMSKLQKEKEKSIDAQKSSYIGEVGQRVTVKIDFCQCVTSWTTQFGMTYIYKFKTEDNALVWKTSKLLDTERVVGFTLTGTIKELKEYRGEKQTELTRCKVSR